MAPAPQVQTAAIQVHFSIPYRVNFGQSMAIVGSARELGAWTEDERVSSTSVSHHVAITRQNAVRVPNTPQISMNIMPLSTVQIVMDWSEGDVWRTKVDTSTPHLEYKYVILNHDGSISLWKPGGNFEIDMAGFSGKVLVEDSWDGTLHEVETSGSWESSAPTATPPPAIPGQGEDITPEEGEQLAVTDASALDEEYDAALKEELRKAYGELESTLQTSLQLAEDADPADPRLLRNDQKLAAVHRRATSLSKAIDAGAPPPAYILKEIQKQGEDGDEQEEPAD